MKMYQKENKYLNQIQRVRLQQNKIRKKNNVVENIKANKLELRFFN